MREYNIKYKTLVSDYKLIETVAQSYMSFYMLPWVSTWIYRAWLVLILQSTGMKHMLWNTWLPLFRIPWPSSQSWCPWTCGPSPRVGPDSGPAFEQPNVQLVRHRRWTEESDAFEGPEYLKKKIKNYGNCTKRNLDRFQKQIIQYGTVISIMNANPWISDLSSVGWGILLCQDFA